MDLSIWEELRNRLNLRALGKPALIGLAALIVMVAVFAGKNLVEAATASDFEVVSEAGEGDSSASVDAQSSSSAPPTIFVHISGAVKKPGLVELEPSARVADAVEAAGGFTKDADIDSVNLARTLADGEQVRVAEEGDEPVSTDVAGNQVRTDAEGGSMQNAASPATSGKVNVNTASQSELESLPGIGPATAEKIIADRAANGSFTSIDDLMRVSGIGEKKLEGIADLICV